MVVPLHAAEGPECPKCGCNRTNRVTNELRICDYCGRKLRRVRPWYVQCPKCKAYKTKVDSTKPPTDNGVTIRYYVCEICSSSKGKFTFKTSTVDEWV